MENFTVPSSVMPQVHAVIEKLNKKAQKVGMPNLAVNILSKQKRFTDTNTNFEQNYWPTIEVTTFEVNCQIIKLQGWTFLGTLDHKSIPGKVIVQTVPGKHIPAIFYNSQPICQHCDKIRHRTETFVVEHDNGDLKQVGRQCLAEFLGIDPTAAIKLLESLKKLTVEFQGEEFHGSGSSEEYFYNINHILSLSAAVTRISGYVSKQTATSQGTQSTGDFIKYLLLPPKADSYSYADWLKNIQKFKPTASDIEQGKQACEWIKTQYANNGYMNNVINIANAGEIKLKLVGYAGSIIVTYLRHIEKQAKFPLICNDQHLGNINEKIVTNVTVTSTRFATNQYGTVNIINMCTHQGHNLTHFSSNGVKLETGKNYKISCTVKKHDTYCGKPQTVVNWLKIIDNS